MAFEILEHAGVAVAPGVDFGSRGEGFIRFAYTTSQSQIREGIRRLKKYLRN
jgi:aspartate/methionine/tyrosine aminotransferase